MLSNIKYVIYLNCHTYDHKYSWEKYVLFSLYMGTLQNASDVIMCSYTPHIFYQQYYRHEHGGQTSCKPLAKYGKLQWFIF